jgi:ribosomal protein L31E
MKPQHSLKKSPAELPAKRVVKDIRCHTRRHFLAEDKIKIVLKAHDLITRPNSANLRCELCQMF